MSQKVGLSLPFVFPEFPLVIGWYVLSDARLVLDLPPKHPQLALGTSISRQGLEGQTGRLLTRSTQKHWNLEWAEW